MAHATATELVRPQTLYARSGDVHVAYQVVGEGPFDLVFVPGFVAFIFLTSASSERRMRKPVARMAATLTDCGYEVVGHFWCRGFWNPWWRRLIGGVNKGHPDQADLDAAAAFARGRIEQANPKARAEIQPA